MKEKLLLDLVLGFALLSLWLNFQNGYIQLLFNRLSEQYRLAFASLIIVSVPIASDVAFNYSNQGSTTFFTAILSAGITLVLREGFTRWKEENDMKGEIFSELYGNYRTIKEFVDTSEMLQGLPPKDLGPDWNKSLKHKWISQSFKSYFGKLQSRGIYESDVLSELQDIYDKLSTAVAQIDSNDPTFSDSRFVSRVFLKDDNLGILGQIRLLLLRLDEKRSSQILEAAMGRNL